MTRNKRPPTDISPLIDAHAHVGAFRNFHIPDAGPDGLVRAMDALGIDMTMLSSHAAISSDIVRGNDETLAAIDRHPTRLRGYCVVNPNYPGLTPREIERCFAHPGIRGFKFHPELHGDYPLDHDGYRAAWEYADAH
ncbi:MAG: amidohydrolase, partial [Microbacteriaceae bacterium]